MTEPTLAEGSLDRRVPPRGVAGAKLCILVPQPEPDDAAGLLTGGAGKLLTAMLQAMGVGVHEVYVASTLPAPMPMPEWSSLGARGLGDVTRHHLALAAPERVLAIGRAQLTLFDIAPEKVRDPLVLECGGKTLPLLAAPDFLQIARSAARRANLWHRWLEWTA
jgi:DNA polymerase